VGVDRAANQVLLNPTAEEFQAGATSTTATPAITPTTTPTSAPLDAIAVFPATTTSPGIGQ
jgi:hypothetical protein